MSVSTTETVVTATLTGETDTVPFAYPFTQASDLTVKNTTTGATLGLGVDYSVSGGGTVAGGGFATGSVTFIDTSATSTNQNIEIRRTTPRTQDTEYVEAGRFSSTLTETALDKLTLVTQETSADAFSRLDFGTVSGSGVYGTNSLDEDEWRSDADLAEDLAIAADLALNSRLTAFENAALKFFGTTVISDEAALGTAISTANDDTTVTVRRTLGAQIPITSNKTIPPNLDLVIPPATGFSMGAGKELVMHGAITAGDYQIFFGTWVSGASPSFYGRLGNMGWVNPMWWGAIPIDTSSIATEADSYAALRAALDFGDTRRDGTAANWTVRLPYGVVKSTSPLFLQNQRTGLGVSVKGTGLSCGIQFYGLSAATDYCLRIAGEGTVLDDFGVVCGGAAVGIAATDNLSERSELIRVGVSNFALRGIDFSDYLNLSTGVTGGCPIRNCVVSTPTAVDAIGIDCGLDNASPTQLLLEKNTIVDGSPYRYLYGLRVQCDVVCEQLNVEGYRQAGVYLANGSSFHCRKVDASPNPTLPLANPAAIYVAPGNNINVEARVINSRGTAGAWCVYEEDASLGFTLGTAVMHFYERMPWNLYEETIPAPGGSYVVRYSKST